MAKRSKRPPNRRKLSESIVRSLPPGPPVWDTLLPSFGIRVGKRTKTWVAGVIGPEPSTRHAQDRRVSSDVARRCRAAARVLLAGDAPATPVKFGELVEQFLADGRTRSGRSLRPPACVPIAAF